MGYGVVAPEFDWDDYKGMDMTGKTLVMLVNDPAVPNAAGDGLDPDTFRGDAMTYYGRWTYKYEIASAKGAAAAIDRARDRPRRLPVRGHLERRRAGELRRERAGRPGGAREGRGLDDARGGRRSCSPSPGSDFDSLKTPPPPRDFRPVPLGATRQHRPARTRVREVQSQQRGREARRATIPRSRTSGWCYTAHWDHLGRDSSLAGDQIYNGALDNASGTAALLEIAGAFAKLPERAPRSLLFVAVTAEEQGLLGAKWYAEQPLYPLAKTLANINMDGVNQWGRTRDITVIGLGNSTLDEELRAVAARDGPHAVARPGAGEGLLLPQRPLRVRQEGRAGAVHRERRRLRRTSRRASAR